MISILTRDEYDFIEESNEIECEAGVDFDHIKAFINLKKTATLKSTLSDADILKCHHTLMNNKLDESLGEYRKVDVIIGATGKRLLAPQHIELAMQEWLKDFNEQKGTPWELHARYENIHPFIDGNGRTGRLFWAFDLLRRNEYVYSILNDFRDGERFDSFNACRQKYYSALDK